MSDMTDDELRRIVEMSGKVSAWPPTLGKNLANAALSARAELARVAKERDRFEAALGRACLVGGTTYLIECAEAAEAGAATLRDRLAVVERETWNAAIAEALKMVKSPPMMTQREALAIVSRKIGGLKK